MRLELQPWSLEIKEAQASSSSLVAGLSELGWRQKEGRRKKGKGSGEEGEKRQKNKEKERKRKRKKKREKTISGSLGFFNTRFLFRLRFCIN